MTFVSTNQPMNQPPKPKPVIHNLQGTLLVLARNVGQSVKVETPAGPVWVKLMEVGENKAKIGFNAPKAWRIMREELL